MENAASRSQPLSPFTARPTPARRPRKGVTMPELMVVIGIIVVLMAILLPALQAVRAQTVTTSSMNNLRQIATFSGAYTRDNREIVLPSQFSYRGPAFTYKGKVRNPPNVTEDPTTGHWNQGTWADILWTENGLGSFPLAAKSTYPADGGSLIGHDYQYMAPDKALYEVIAGTIQNPLRAAAMNTKNFQPKGGGGDGAPKPHGDGAHEAGLPGLFAANDFFNAHPDAPPYMGAKTPETGRWWYAGQIRAPERSMYLVDSFAGEVIASEAEPFNNVPDAAGYRSIEVDFRHSGTALMLMMDGSISPESPWQQLADLEEKRKIRIRELDRHMPGP